MRQQRDRIPLRCWFTDFWHPETEEGIKGSGVRIRLLPRFDIQLDKESPQVLFFSCFGERFRRYNCPRICWIGESVDPNFADCDFAVSFDADRAGRNHYYPLAGYMGVKSWDDFLQHRNADEALAAKTRFCNFIYSNGDCEERNALFQLLSEYKRVDAPGEACNNMDASAELQARHGGSWHDSKRQFLRPYRFTIAAENSSKAGYTTEKIVDAFWAQSVPIYWGNPQIEQLFNPDSFVNCHRYNSLAEAMEAVKEIDSDEERYRGYLEASPLIGGKPHPSFSQERMLDALEQFVVSAIQSPERAVQHRLRRDTWRRRRRGWKKTWRAVTGRLTSR